MCPPPLEGYCVPMAWVSWSCTDTQKFRLGYPTPQFWSTLWSTYCLHTFGLYRLIIARFV